MYVWLQADLVCNTHEHYVTWLDIGATLKRLGLRLLRAGNAQQRDALARMFGSPALVDPLAWHAYVRSGDAYDPFEMHEFWVHKPDNALC